MNNEIKEILDFKEDADYKRLSVDEITILRDYITNLQEENEELNDDNIWWNNRFKAVQRNYKDYKSRCEKAIEYIENNFISYEDSRTFGQLGEEIEIQVKEIRYLFKILKGDSSNE